MGKYGVKRNGPDLLGWRGGKRPGGCAVYLLMMVVESLVILRWWRRR